MPRKADTVARYFRRLASFATNPADYDGVLHPEYQAVEHPSIQNPTLRTSGFAERLQRVAESRKRFSAQHFAIANQIEDDLQVVVEVDWSGLLGADFGAHKKGKSLKGRFCMVFEFRDEKIYRQKCYETFDPAAG